MALLVSKAPEGMLGLRWSKLKMGPCLTPDIRSVQVRLPSAVLRLYKVEALIRLVTLDIRGMQLRASRLISAC